MKRMNQFSFGGGDLDSAILRDGLDNKKMRSGVYEGGSAGSMN